MLSIFYKKMKRYSQKYFSTILYWIFEKKKTYMLATSMMVVEYFAYQVKGIDVFYKKVKCYFEKK